MKGADQPVPPERRVLETARLALRWLTADDAAFILALLNEPSFLRFIGDRGVRTSVQARDYILNGPVASYAQFGFGLYLVLRKADGAVLGICGLLKRETLADVDVGFAFLPEFWSRGYAFEAAEATVAHGRRDFGLKRIVAVTSPDNAASIRLIEKLGMQFERMVQLKPGSPEIRLYVSAD
jgi:RimJ/RimL family protein N-acetyltransferase